jgi:hypothetical protein
MLTILAWAASGAKWKLYLATAIVAIASAGFIYLRWRARLRRSIRQELAAAATARKLARALEGIKVDDQIRTMSFAARRERLRYWAATD